MVNCPPAGVCQQVSAELCVCSGVTTITTITTIRLGDRGPEIDQVQHYSNITQAQEERIPKTAASRVMRHRLEMVIKIVRRVASMTASVISSHRISRTLDVDCREHVRCTDIVEARPTNVIHWRPLGISSSAE
jgi:hypothetical protein